MKILKFFLFLLILCFDLTNNGPYTTDIIGQCDATDSLYEDKHDSFGGISSRDITKTNSQHDIGPPVVSPYVFRIPLFIGYVYFSIPIMPVLA